MILLSMLRQFYDYILALNFMINLQSKLVRKLNPISVFSEWWISPMGGQARRVKKVIELVDIFQPDLIIETGTFIGSTTPLLATLFDTPVITIELSERLAKRNILLFSKLYPNLNIKQVVGNSASELKNILNSTSSDKKLFVYLDAHWFDYLPTTDELNTLVAWGGEFIALIDDFKNEFDSGYGFDEYRSGLHVGKDLIPKNSGLHVFVPRINSKKEGLARRGTAYVFSKHVISKHLDLDLEDLIKIV
jgi:hypothetical protein